ETRDVGFLPEDEIHGRSEGSTPYEVARDEKRYPIERVLAAAELASSDDRSTGATARLRTLLRDEDSAVRYWAASGMLARGGEAVESSHVELRDVLTADPSPGVRIAAAEALAQHGSESDVKRAVETLIELASLERS